MENRRQRKMREGRVVSDRMDKTVVVSLEHVRRHPLYERVIRRSHKVQAHDERNECHVGDLVQIAETRPLSRNKFWRVVKIVEKSRG
ncbi:MAG: 30S ribosomal protein S17 [Armatimonadetes bacterium CG_4_10_14_3_um_filter_66_18]|nr:30S ribosomal protein S17 [Armatimonadota bacterium]OIO95675.1 MAG: 30S ribosomal protein S17 [Armatimonadetes bacterium CG2_30_66_41]PIU94066.1 MAG: 30S ribosomal protein S17 [Armatimonadetes bacterium CG06_land_8_20_14_3_00_66_21]PIW13272.1 MAG: 30S ribosomal protein S17 [Armatimonadetes bacterium CG17_big_fil_post_rev_8_21_14_2_50_66_6]PIX43078.1 MAG: 30S ribosomal protein S17 [Armatimonadetes bacterium CG_4_8_14_3_um_filter_66_20]PIY36202.1 MAG: 30S ribosomal protein S17 [Armatimonadete